MQMRAIVMISILFVSGGVSVATPQFVQAQPSLSANSTPWKLPSHEELLQQIKACQDAFHNAQADHAADQPLGKIDVLLGSLYSDAGMYPQSEAALKQAVQLLRNAPPVLRATALAELAVLHTTIGESHKSLKENREAIVLFEQAGDVRDAAYQRADLANAETTEGHFREAVNDAQKGLEALGDDPTATVTERIGLHQALGYALAKSGRCQEAIPALQETVELAKSGFGDDSLTVGIEYYILGHVAWTCGDPAGAANWMQWGIERMKPDLGWGHVIYLDSVSEYAKFLRERGQMERADAEEREVRMAHALVDVRTMTAAPVNGLH